MLVIQHEKVSSSGAAEVCVSSLSYPKPQVTESRTPPLLATESLILNFFMMMGAVAYPDAYMRV